MLESHAQHNDALQAFHKWRTSSAALWPGTGGPNFETECQFIPRSKLEDYFRDPHRLENLLKAVLNEEERTAVDVNYVRSHYSRSFATLLCIGEGRLIRHFQQYESLRDEKLPHNTPPDDFAIMLPDIFEKFESAQRPFCASNLDYSMNRRYKEKEIIPIISKEKIGEGGSAIVYKIVVHEDYNLLRPHSRATPNRPKHKNTFVLKTYRTAEDAQNYKAERDAFMKLRWGQEPSPHIIAYYGGFIHGNSHNAILEYADRGTLESFMRETEPPLNVEQALFFWSRLTDVLSGIMTIHGKIGRSSSASQIYNGYHQDVKPANILVFSGAGSSPYDCHFKIADLGLTHFRPSSSQPDDPLELDVFGTRAYGSPETFRGYPDTESAPLQVTSAVDMWSLGCIFSETAVWAHFGWKRVDEYRRQRSAEIKCKGGGEGEYNFHHEGILLDAVGSIHGNIMKSRQSGQTKSHITRLVLERLVDDMLQPGDRPSAKNCFEKSKRLIETDAKQFEVPQNWLVVKPSGWLGDSDEARNGVRSSTSIKSKHAYGVSKATLDKYQSPRGGGERDASLTQPFPPDDDSALSSSCSDLQPSPRRQLHKSASQGSGPGSANHMKTFKSGGQAPHNESSPSPSPLAAGKPHETSEPQPARQHQGEPIRPILTIDEGHEWKRKKKNHEYVELHGAENLTFLDEGDHIFLIDNSATMRQYSRDTEKVVSLLAYMLKESDKNGIDIYFTLSLKVLNSKKSSKLVSSICQEPFRGVADMAGSLRRIMQPHIEKFGTSVLPSRMMFLSRPPSRPQRPLSFYILTDAKWQPTDVEGFITRLVGTMIDKNCAKEHVAIQFIRFGEDPASIEKLDKLDTGLGLKARGMDIVDHTYWKDNVWKMLLGGINGWYDDDPS